jgi:hypothetical protein
MKTPTFTPALKIPIMISQEVNDVRRKMVSKPKTIDILFISRDFKFQSSIKSTDISLTDETLLSVFGFHF